MNVRMNGQHDNLGKEGDRLLQRPKDEAPAANPWPIGTRASVWWEVERLVQGWWGQLRRWWHG